MAKYITCGNIMSDITEYADGSRSEFHMGGPAIFGLEGVRIFEPSCAMVCVAGFDWVNDYALWLDRHGITRDTVKVLPDLEVSRCLIQHRPDGTYKWVPLQGMEHINRMRFTWHDVDSAITEETKGLYIPFLPDEDFFLEFDKTKRRTGCRIMWEFGVLVEDVYKDKKLMAPIHHCEMFSINSNEASRLYGIPKEDDEAIIRRLQQLPVEFTLYRVGSRGAFGVTREGAWFCPSVDPRGSSVDPSGCGNCSTAAATYGWCETGDAARTAAIACVAAGFNAAQYGLFDHITPAVTREANALVEQLLQHTVRRVY